MLHQIRPHPRKFVALKKLQRERGETIEFAPAARRQHRGAANILVAKSIGIVPCVIQVISAVDQ
jgi:hypothetical protein